jgi:hypothetical protein
MAELEIAHVRLNRRPLSPRGKDGEGCLADVYSSDTGVEPVTLDIEVSDSTRASLDVPGDLMAERIANALRDLVASRVDIFVGLALEQVRAWAQPIVLQREHFPL